MNHKRKPSLLERIGKSLKEPKKIPPWQKWVVAGLIVGIAAQPLFTLGVAMTRLLLEIFHLSEFNPGNVVGVCIGLLCAAGGSSVIFKGVLALATLRYWKQAIASLSFWMLSICAVVGSGLGTLSLSLILLPGLDLKLALVFAVFVAGLVTAALVESQWIFWDLVLRGRKLRTDLKTLPANGSNHRRLPWGKLWVEKSQESLGYFILGAPGMGKSTWLEVLMTIALGYIGIVPNYRGLVVDSKPDQSAGMVPFLEALGVPYKILNPLDRTRCCAWDMALDITGEARAAELSAVLIPENENQKDNKYFIDAARLLLTAVIVALQTAKGTKWTLRDLLLACSNKNDLLLLLKNHHPRYQAYEEFFKDKKGKNEVLTTLQANLLPLNIVAARWERAPEKISLRNWLRGEYVLVMGSDFEFPETLKRINQLLFRFIASGLKSLPDDPERRVWMFIDELAAISPLPELENLLALGRSKSLGTVLSTQNLPALVRILGREKTFEIFGLCARKAIMGVDPETAKLLSEYFSDYEYVETTYNASVSYGPQGTSTTEGTQDKRGTRRTVTAQQFMDMNFPAPGPENGLSAFFTAPGEGIHFHRYEWEEIQQMRVQRVDSVTAYERIDDDDPTTKLLPWSDEEREALGLA
ncbi:type IV secretion system DNA-binding domain-containing protein [Lusitaniella coriacea LEGE 07157]|uniref:Type IV secretion system DNA-binding domain-containing protein n=1 Tax=Lusitaniella coriacea LEGE 07157 TaxID=945747 RepID=A0A8J7DXR6_9CYAN|nr:type IV secretion system DNA-binding domain-containing protein [Lusitaniella coriacea]MBE9117256.1 type IV secretion system DNA-binding domain-containing protein [Lusitaniella coriacea LEGE 07157]